MKTNQLNAADRWRGLPAVLLLALIVSLVLAACGAPASAPTTGDAPASSQIVVIIPEEPASLNQYHALPPSSARWPMR